jgi:hypothetical protein
MEIVANDDATGWPDDMHLSRLLAHIERDHRAAREAAPCCADHCIGVRATSNIALPRLVGQDQTGDMGAVAVVDHDVIDRISGLLNRGF